MEPRKHSRIFYLGIFFTLPLLAIAVIVFVVMHGLERVTTAAAPKIERAVTRTISESIASIRATNGDVLVLAEVEVTETFRDTDRLQYKIPYTELNVPIGTTVSEVRVPAVFRYYVKLGDPMTVTVSKHDNLHRCVIVMPELRPLLPVAFDSNRMEVRVETGWARFNKEEAREKIIKSITGNLNTRAPAHAELAKDKARQAFEKFVREWLLRGELLGGSGVNDIVIQFCDETRPPKIDSVQVE